MAHMQKFVDRWSANAKRSTQAQSRAKAIAKIEEDLVEEVEQGPTAMFKFPTPDKI